MHSPSHLEPNKSLHHVFLRGVAHPCRAIIYQCHGHTEGGGERTDEGRTDAYNPDRRIPVDEFPVRLGWVGLVVCGVGESSNLYPSSVNPVQRNKRAYLALSYVLQRSPLNPSTQSPSLIPVTRTDSNTHVVHRTSAPARERE
jgi:hypothetical protein